MKSNPSTIKNNIYFEIAQVVKALANPIRLELLHLLCQAPRTVENIAQLTGQSVATTSHHLRTLLAARLLTAEKNGLYVTYRPASDDIGNFWVRLLDLTRNHLVDLQTLGIANLAEVDADQSIERVTLMAQMRRDEVALIDVRPVEEYEAGHIPGALSVPLENLEEMLPSLPWDRQIIICGRGPFCMPSLMAMEIFHRRNQRAKCLVDDILQWKAAGLPVKVGTDDLVD
ncbi:MAG: ArsR family transcriptional regulator [Fidelibacterota bacterium]|nr:MAG: ArsR family transcriptional regulator [Candidatus Neomarinimicrobiota bacterium]